MTGLRKLRIAVLILLILGIGGFIALTAWDPPAPSQQVEKDISNELLKN